MVANVSKHGHLLLIQTRLVKTIVVIRTLNHKDHGALQPTLIVEMVKGGVIVMI